MDSALNQTYQIGEWIYSFDDRQVSKNSEIILLSAAQNSILNALVTHYPQLLNAQQLIDACPAELTLTRNKLYQSVAKLRGIFRDSSRQSKYIETIAKQGYRLGFEPLNIDRPREIELFSLVTSGIAQPSEAQDDTISAQYTQQENTSNQEFVEQSTLLDRNIFDDLGFMKTSSNDGNESLSKQDEHTAKEDEVSADLSTKPPTQRIRKRTLLMALLFISMTLLLSIKYWPTSIVPVPVFVPSEVIYVKQQNLANNTLPVPYTALAIDNMQWWLTQKVLHLPGIKVVITEREDLFPLLMSGVDIVDEKHIKLRLSLYRDSQQKTAFDMSINVIDGQPQQMAQEIQRFDDQLVAQILQSTSLKLSDDSCIFNDFVHVNQSNNRECLVVLRHQSEKLVAQLLMLSPLKAEYSGVLAQLAKLQLSIVNSFPQNSLGYLYAAHAAKFNNQPKEMLLGLIKAVERNQNDTKTLEMLGEAYTKELLHQQSLQITKQLVALYPKTKSYQKMLAHNYVALGYLAKAHRLLRSQKIKLETPSEQLYFSLLNYNQLSVWTEMTPPLNPQQKQLIRQKLDNQSFFDLQHQPSLQQRIAKLENELSEQRMNRWQLGALYLINNQADNVLKCIGGREDYKQVIAGFSIFDDAMFYVPTYANALLMGGKQAQAYEVLNRFIAYLLQEQGHDPVSVNLWALPLAEAYALLGEHDLALAQMAKLLATGWLPDPSYQVWTLANNPNLNALRDQWQFINLLELIENRRQLIRLKLLD
ncbi:MAG: winged helix-turn-helix domain-containing protein [Psychrobium sp.]|nr:winged helix-turn-helix domain-containing protein [Psychrobium sp.]